MFLLTVLGFYLLVGSVIAACLLTSYNILMKRYERGEMKVSNRASWHHCMTMVEQYGLPLLLVFCMLVWPVLVSSLFEDGGKES